MLLLLCFLFTLTIVRSDMSQAYISGISLWRPRFGARQVHVSYVLDKVLPWWPFCFLSTLCSTCVPFSFIRYPGVTQQAHVRPQYQETQSYPTPRIGSDCQFYY